MGREIEVAAKEYGDNIVFIADSIDTLKESLDKYDSTCIDIVYEFTEPGSAYNNIVMCIERGISVVSGTTGWLERIDDIRKLCKEVNGTLLWASNFSIPVNLFFRINKYASKLFNKFAQYEIKVEEIHHKWKKDKPSGTAITLVEDIIENIERKKEWQLLCEEISTKKEDTIYVKADRYEDVFGIHKVIFYNDNDEIEIKHKLHNRRSLAEGALLAGHWLVGRKGFYMMDDYINEIFKDTNL